MNQSPFLQKHFKKIVALIVILLVIWIGWAIYRASTFHVASTNPNVSSVNTETPFFKINFSKTLANTKPLVSASEPIVRSSAVSGKTLTINFTIPLNANQKYTITVASITDANGKQLTNLHFVFTPKYVTSSDIPTDQQQTLLQQQSDAASNQPTNFIGTDTLINNGLSDDQVQDFEQAIDNFSTSTKTHITSATIDTNSVTPGPLDPNSPSPTLNITFNVALDSTNYKASLNYSGVTSAELFLNNSQTGSQVYDSGMLASGQN